MSETITLDHSRPFVPHEGLTFGGFVVLMASIMALNGLAIDSMLPALPHIGEEFGLQDENRSQWIISAYLLGFGACQIFFGPLADRYGRRGPLLFGVGMYALFSLVAVFVTSFEVMILTRVLQGAGAAATRSLSVAIVRDNYSGRRMASVMSLVFIVFLVVPILAPLFGQGLMLFVSWHWIFAALAVLSSLLFWQIAFRLPESLRPEDKLPLEIGRVFRAFAVVLTTRMSIGYTLAMTLVLGALFAFINSAQQIFADVFGIPALFTLVFASIAGCMALSSFINSRIVERIGSRRVSHTAIIGFTVFSAINLLTAVTGDQTLLTFSVLLAATMFCFGLTGPNFGAMAMEPVGHIAGTASSVQGCVTTLGGAVIGFIIGQQYDGSTLPLLVGFTLLGASAIAVVLVTEKRLFQAQNTS